MNRLRQTRPGLVFLSMSGPFGPRRWRRHDESPHAGMFYEGLVVASRQGPPLTEPPAYGEASPALEHLVLYDDGSSEWLTLKNEKVRYVQATRAAQLVGQVTASLSADDDMSWFAAPVAACVEILCFNVGSRAVGVRCRSRGTVVAEFGPLRGPR